MKTQRPNIKSALDELFEPHEASNLKMRSKLMFHLITYIKEYDLTQDEAAKRFGVGQPRVSHLMNGKVDKFTIDALINMCNSAGLNVELHVDGAYA